MAEQQNWLEKFKGQRVTVATISGNDERTDTGHLVQIGDGWLQISKDNGEMMLIPSTAIRIIKLLDMTQMTPAIETDHLNRLDTHVYEPNAQTI